MDSDRQFRRMRHTGAWIFAAVIIAIASPVTIGVLFGRFSPVAYPPYFFFPWIFIPLFFFGFFFAFRWWGWGHWWNSERYYDSAPEILRERFARGEITKDQYEQMGRDLGVSS